MKLRDLSVGRKLMIVTMGGISVALLLLCAVLLTYDIATTKRTTSEHLSTMAQVIADNSKAALSFGDQAAAAEVLGALKAEPHVTAAYVFDKDGKSFAAYHPSSATTAAVPPLRKAGSYLEGDRLMQYQPMWLSGEQIGVVYVESDLKELKQRYRSYGAIVVLVMACSWLAALLMVRRLQKTITEPLNQLIAVSQAISEHGDLEHDIDVERQDELGSLARSFNSMVAYLKEMAAVSERIAEGDLSHDVEPRSDRDVLGRAFAKMTDGLEALVQNVRLSASQVASGSIQVAGASDNSAKVSYLAASAIDEVTNTMHEMSVNVQSVVKNTQMQSSSVSETSAAIEEMIANIDRVAGTAKVLLDISSRSRDEVQNGMHIMQKTSDGLNRINTSIASCAGTIVDLGERANNINNIVEVIDTISEQTNLLALNAAIEAARAGEHGLGFAVVADEVRKLAEKSAKSANEISELLSVNQKEARKAVETMEKSTAIVNEGLALGGELSTALEKIYNVVSEVLKFAQQIGAATKEQSTGSSQIVSAAFRLNEITHEISSSVEEQAVGVNAVATAMDRMRELVQQSTSSSSELAASAEQMSKMASSLLSSMDRFVLEEHSASHSFAASAR